MKRTAWILIAAALLAGCSAPVVLQRDRTRSLAWTVKAPLDQAWQAATNAAREHPLTIMKLDADARFIAAGTPAGFGTDGELVGIWLSQGKNGAHIEVSSKPISLLALGNTDWRHPVAQRICAALGEPAPPAPPPLRVKSYGGK